MSSDLTKTTEYNTVFNVYTHNMLSKILYVNAKLPNGNNCSKASDRQWFVIIWSTAYLIHFNPSNALTVSVNL